MYEVMFLLKYITNWITMAAAVIFLLALSEAVYGSLLVNWTGGGRALLSHPIRSAAASIASPLVLPDRASEYIALWAPVLAIAALFPACSSISFFTFSPLIDNGGDILQILHFVILSEFFALTAIYALGTEYAFRCAGRLAGEFVKLLVTLTASFASFALYFSALGAQGGLFSLNIYSLSLHLKSLNIPGYFAVAAFVFLSLSHSAHCEECAAGDIFTELPQSEYNGPPRALLQVWAAFKAFLTATLITHILFPWFVFKESDLFAMNSFLTELFPFTLFWVTVIIVRTFGVMLCHSVRRFIEKKLGVALAAVFMLILLAAAMGIIYHEAYLIALEAY